MSRSQLPFEYSVVRAARKTLAVYVREEQVEVRAPRFVSDVEITDFVHKHLNWISRKLAHKASQARQRLRIIDQGTIFYKARERRIRFLEAAQASVVVTDRELQIHGRNLNEQLARRVLETWLLQQAKAWLPGRTRALATYLKVDHKLREVVFRKTKTKWGHCTSGGRIQYNWLIMLAPDAIIDYMICHETCHLLEMNHSRRYWRHVESLCPDYRQYVKWLKTHEHRLWPQ